MNLFKTSFYTSISTAISFISGFIVVKVVAIEIGPSGMAYLGQFQNTASILTMLATGAIGMGVVKYLAQYKNDPLKKSQIISTAVVVVFFCSIIISIFILLTSGGLSEKAFKTDEFKIVYLLYGIFTMTISYNVLFAAILNGLNEIKKLTIVNICSSIIGVILTVLFAYHFGVKGVLLSSTALSIVIFFIHILILRKANIVWKPNFKEFDKSILKLFFGFTLMALVSGLLVPTIQFLVRDKIIQNFTLDQAGYWQGITKISDYYLTFITLVLGVYYMPKLSELQNKSALRFEIFRAYKIVLPIVMILAAILWLNRELIIQILFSSSFQPMKPLFTFQLLGDVFKIASWLLANLMIAKAMVRLYIITEFIFAFTYVVLCFYFINQFGIIGATYGFCINYFLYWVTMIFIMKKKI